MRDTQGSLSNSLKIFFLPKCTRQTKMSKQATIKTIFMEKKLVTYCKHSNFAVPKTSLSIPRAA